MLLKSSWSQDDDGAIQVGVRPNATAPLRADSAKDARTRPALDEREDQQHQIELATHGGHRLGGKVDQVGWPHQHALFRMLGAPWVLQLDRNAPPVAGLDGANDDAAPRVELRACDEGSQSNRSA